MKRTVLSIAMANVLTVASAGVYAALPLNATLEFKIAAANGTVKPADGTGAWFSMAVSATTTAYTGISSLNGIALGTTQAASGSHTGLPGCTPSSACNGSAPLNEQPNIDNAWGFFGNTGMHLTVSAPTITSDDGGGNANINIAGWEVTWNGIPHIPMGAGAWGSTSIFSEGIANVVCASDCTGGDSYTLDYHGTVPAGDPSGFGGVRYGLHLEGIIGVPGTPPVAVNDPGNRTIVDNDLTIVVTANDIANGTFTPGSVTTTVDPAVGSTTDNADNTITYTPGPADPNPVTFSYTVDNASGTSNPAMVGVTTAVNVQPDAVDDPLNSNTAALDNAGGSITVNVLANDTDPNNNPGLPGGINTTSVTIIPPQPPIGTCTANGDGTITYSQPGAAVEETFSCEYRISDIDPVNGALTDTAFLNINIADIQSDWPPALDPDIIPFLIFDDGVPNSSGNTADIPESGTYFSMDVSANTTIYTTLTKGPDGGFVIGYDQLATGSHTGLPTGNETASVDLGWNFFGNTGLTFTKNGGITGNNDGTLKFNGNPNINNGQGKYQITWNGIPEIDLGGSKAFPQDLGFALISCNPAPCADGSTFDLAYEAHVPPGDPSGFGGVQYKLIMSGAVAFLDGSFQTSSGTFSVEERAQAGDSNIEPDPDSEIQCAGGCFDYTITGVNGPSVSVVLPLNSGVPASTLGQVQLRVFRDGAWGNFDASGNNSVMSAAFTSGGPFGTTCPPPGDAAYGSLTEGHQCLQVTIEDNGPNDKNSAVGTISDPSGLGIPTIEPAPDNRSSGTSGCTVASAPVSPLRGGAWWLLAGLAGWIGWNRRQSKLQ